MWPFFQPKKKKPKIKPTKSKKIGTDYLKIGEASRYLGVCQDTLRNWERQGLLVPRRFGVRQDRLYSKTVLDSFFEKQINHDNNLNN